VLREVFAGARKVLEIGSGTGQHAVHFATHLPHLIWQPADLAENLPGIELWRAEAAPGPVAADRSVGLPNLLPPLVLDVNRPRWPETGADAVFSANTLHIMSWSEVRLFFAGVGRVLPADGVLAVYGPFNYGGRYSSQSNARFDRSLRSRDPHSGVRDFEAVDALAAEQKLVLERDVAMPANNRTLVWRREVVHTAHRSGASPHHSRA
jgi:hypothetical protein